MIEDKIVGNNVANNRFGRMRSSAVILAGLLAVASPLYASCGDEREDNSCGTDKESKNSDEY